jgi:hypothetical protein
MLNEIAQVLSSMSPIQWVYLLAALVFVLIVGELIKG